MRVRRTELGIPMSRTGGVSTRRAHNIAYRYRGADSRQSPPTARFRLPAPVTPLGFHAHGCNVSRITITILDEVHEFTRDFRNSGVEEVIPK